MKRSPLVVLAWAAAALLQAGCLLIENQFVFHPAPSTGGQLPQGTSVRDVKLRSADDVLIHARWRPHPSASGAVLYCPGNAGNLEQRERIVRELHQNLGESVLIFDYPGFGRSEGDPSENGCYAAAEVAYEFLTRHMRIPPERIIIYGESLGGGVAMELAGRNKHRALVLVRTFTSIPDIAQEKLSWLPVRWLVQNQFDNLKRIGKCTQPVFIASAENDKLIPKMHAYQLSVACRAPKSSFVMKGLGHNDPPSADFYQALRIFLSNHEIEAGGAAAGVRHAD